MKATLPKKNNPGEITLTLLIPAYNEEKRLLPTLVKVDEFLKGRGYSYEILVVDGGSLDGTSRVVREFQKSCSRARLIRLEKNRGKGFHIRTGMREAAGKYIIFTDADCSTSVKEIDKLMDYLSQGYDLVCGSRKLFESNIVLPQNWVRRRMGKVYSLLARAIGVKDIKDIPCGFKGFTRQAARAIFPKMRLTGFSFDAEVLYVAQRKYKHKIIEVPILWKDSRGSKVVLFKDPLLMTLDLVKIRFFDLLGFYRIQEPRP